MTLEDKLRNALRETAGEIPDDPPPLRLSPLAVSRHPVRRRPAKQHRAQHHGARWPAWAAPLAAAAAIVALVAALLTLAPDRPNVEGPSNSQGTTTPSGPAAVPPYYVALTITGRNPGKAGPYANAAEVRATATGVVLARITVPGPYAFFTQVTAGAGDRTFVLLAEEKSNPPRSGQPYSPPARFFLLRIAPGAPPGGRVSLHALPAGFIPANHEVNSMALSPDGTSLAADIGPQGGGSGLLVFNLATGTSRTWTFTACRHCGIGSDRLGWGSYEGGALSWTSDGRHLAFVGPKAPPAAGSGASSFVPGSVRLLDVSAPGTNLLANSKIILRWPGRAGREIGPGWRAVVITPDGRTVVFLEQLVMYGPKGSIKGSRGLLAKASVATGQVTVVSGSVKPADQYQQLMYTNATGHALVVYYYGPKYEVRVGILRGNQFTPIPWSPRTVTAAW
jgi:hypothetical protein